VFVDDTLANVEAANRLGIHGVLFTNAADFRAELERLKLL
jgi:2-haloacid dehalogenase